MRVFSRDLQRMKTVLGSTHADEHYFSQVLRQMPSHQATPSEKALSEEVQAYVISIPRFLDDSKTERWDLFHTEPHKYSGRRRTAEEPCNIGALQEVLQDIKDWNL